MKLDKEKFELVMAEKCLTSGEVQKQSGLPKSTYTKAVMEKNVRPATLGKIAKAVNTPVHDLIAEEG